MTSSTILLRIPHSAFHILCGWLLVLSLSGCASWPRSFGTRPCCITTKPILHRESIPWHLTTVTLTSELKRTFNLARLTRRLVGIPVRSLNLHRGEVVDSAFFTNRDPARLSTEAVRWGPTRPEDLAQGPFVITKPKVEGKTPGFFVTDAKGARYLFKLDPVDAPELLSGAEVVTSKLLYALGYHVPSYEIVVLAPDELQVSPRLTVSDMPERSRPLTEADVRPLIEPRLREGVLRVVASKILEGEILGPATFKHFRDCAEMRALKIAYAWLNNIDAKDHNSLLVWSGRETVAHLIDFGTSLGADAGTEGPKTPCAGWLNIVDLQEASLKLLTFGLHQPTCDPQARPVSPSIGLFSAHVDPDRWKPYAPNLAFDEMNDDDARWLARRMARLSVDQIAAAVSAGQYHDPTDAAYLTDTLVQRRDAIIRHYVKEEE